jgi:hypothetical protein
MAAAMRLRSSSTYDVRNTIVVSGSARSGTTWVAQTIASIPGSAVLFEPLNPNRVEIARRAGFGWRTYRRPGEVWPDGERVLDAVLRGRVLTSWTVQEIRRPMRVETWIVKFVEANRILPWLIDRFPVRPPLLLLRHPCAVVASQMAAGWAGHVEHHDPELEKDFPGVKAVLDQVETAHEHRAARWAIDALVPLSRPKPVPWITLPYEWLVRGEEALDPAFERWGISPPHALSERLRRPSSTTERVSDTRAGLTDWTAQLRREDAERILAVTHALGLDFYGSDPEPDPVRLAKWI